MGMGTCQAHCIQVWRVWGILGYVEGVGSHGAKWGVGGVVMKREEDKMRGRRRSGDGEHGLSWFPPFFDQASTLTLCNITFQYSTFNHCLLFSFHLYSFVLFLTSFFCLLILLIVSINM